MAVLRENPTLGDLQQYIQKICEKRRWNEDSYLVNEKREWNGNDVV